MDVHDIVVKHTQPIRIAEAVGTAVGFGNENLGPVFAQLLPTVLGELGRAGVRPGKVSDGQHGVVIYDSHSV